jgi:hypothetical protein
MKLKEKLKAHKGVPLMPAGRDDHITRAAPYLHIGMNFLSL